MPPAVSATASTCAPGREPPTCATDASGGSDAHFARLSSAVTASRVAGCDAPSTVSAGVFGSTIGDLRGRQRDVRAAIGQIDRQRLLERGAGEALAIERSRAEHQQSAAARGDEFVGQLELFAREEVGLDVAEDHAVVGEQLRALERIAARQRRHARRIRLHIKRIPPIVILALAHDGIDLEAGIVGQARA